MRLKTLKTYQSVRFNTKDETSFDLRVPRFEGLIMEYMPADGYVQITLPGKDSIIVFSTNIAYAVVADAPKSELKKVK